MVWLHREGPWSYKWTNKHMIDDDYITWWKKQQFSVTFSTFSISSQSEFLFGIHGRGLAPFYHRIANPRRPCRNVRPLNERCKPRSWALRHNSWMGIHDSISSIIYRVLKEGRVARGRVILVSFDLMIHLSCVFFLVGFWVWGCLFFSRLNTLKFWKREEANVFLLGSWMLMKYVDNDSLWRWKRQYPALYVFFCRFRRSWTFAKRRRDLEVENDD